MNEIRFHTKLMTNPHHLDEDMLCYLEQNPEKKQTVKTVRELDKDISETLYVKVPEGLHARILLNQSYQQNSQPEPVSQQAKLTSLATLKNWSQSWQAGLAASVMAFALIFSVWQPYKVESLQSEHIVEHVLEHVVEVEQEQINSLQLAENRAELHKLFASVGATLSQPLAGMSYAGICDVEGQTGLHIVMQQNDKPVTVIVFPGQQINAMQAFSQSGYQGELIPVEGGMVAIVGDTMVQVALAQMEFFKSVKFV